MLSVFRQKVQQTQQNHTKMAFNWLCTSKTISVTQLAFLLFIFIIANVVHLSTSTEVASEAHESRQTGHQNTLNDEAEHEEFIDSQSNQPHSRKKRLIWITDDGRLALPPGTSLTFTPTIALPLVRHPPEGFFSNMSISFPVTIDFDKLGLTDNQNPLGDLPPIFARSFGRSAGRMLGDYVARYLHVKAKRDLNEQNKSKLNTNPHFHIKENSVNDEHEFPVLPEGFQHVFHGGERVLLYSVVEDFLATFGMNGKACLLRTICEIHSRNLEHFGVFGEMTKLFLTVTKSPFSDLLPDYVRAQEIGEGRQAPGECFPYYKECPRGLFNAMKNHNYSEQQDGEYNEVEAEVISQTMLPDKPKRDELETNEILHKRNAKENLFPM